MGVFGSLKAGVHTYVITATDAAGYSKTLTGQITVTPPKISGATVSLATRQPEPERDGPRRPLKCSTGHRRPGVEPERH